MSSPAHILSHGHPPPRAARRPWLILLTGCLMMAALMALAAPAGAGVGSFRFAVVSKETPSGQGLARMGDAGVAILRITFNWNAMEEPRDPLFERPSLAPCEQAEFPGFARYDDLVSAASDAGIKLLPVLMGLPPYVEQSRPSNAPHSQGNGGRDYKDWKCWVRRVVGRWGFGGEYFEPGGDPTARPIGRWQIHNEPNLPLYGTCAQSAGCPPPPNQPPGQVSPAEYGRLVKATTNTVRRVNPKATTVLAGMPPRVRKGMSSDMFLRELYDVRKIKRKFDAAAIHPYAPNFKGARYVLKSTRTRLRKENDGRRPLWVTETGYATEGQDGHFLVKSEQGQARQLGKTFRMYRENRDRFRLGTVAWFSWKDTAPSVPSTERWPDYAGLYRDDGEPKQSCHRYVDFTNGEDPCRPIVEGVQASELDVSAERSLLGLGRRWILPSSRP